MNVPHEEEGYRFGEPPTQGWYDCIDQDGNDCRLRWWICQVNPRRRFWKNEKDEKVGTAEDITWTGSAEVRR